MSRRFRHHQEDHHEEEERRDESAGGYTDVHRAFLQAFMSRSVMDVEDMKPLLAAVMSAQNPDRPTLLGDITAPIITSTLQTINARLTHLDYEIRSTRDHVAETTVYALVNTTSDALTQLATTFTPEDMAYIKRLLDAMFDTNNTRNREIMAVAQNEAMQLARAPRRARQSQVNGEAGGAEEEAAALKGITMDAAESVLSTLLTQSFFRKTRISGTNYYSLAPRALMELRAYLKETYNDPSDPEDPEDQGVVRIRDCEGCGEIVTVGVRCERRECGVRFHRACAVQFFKGMRGDSVCPGCRAEWTGEVLVGPKAAEVGRRSTVGASSAGRASGRRSTQMVDLGSGSEEEESE